MTSISGNLLTSELLSNPDVLPTNYGSLFMFVSKLGSDARLSTASVPIFGSNLSDMLISSASLPGSLHNSDGFVLNLGTVSPQQPAGAVHEENIDPLQAAHNSVVVHGDGEADMLRSDLPVPPQNKSFVHALNPLTAAPVRKDEFSSVNIDDLIHRQGVLDLVNSIIERILLR